MRKIRYLFIPVLLVILYVPCLIVFAHPTQKQHDDELKEVLFRDHSLSIDQMERFQAIADAASLCIDQFSPDEVSRFKETLFNNLKQRIGFSFSFDDIELQDLGNGKNASAKNHRRYTHRGWNYDQYPKQDLWEKRKKILTATVNKELFGQSSGVIAKVPIVKKLIHREDACNEECDAFCQLVYCIHILGDYIEAKSYTNEFQQLIPLVRHEDPTAPSMIDDLISVAKILFKDQEWRLSSFTHELEEIREDAEDALFITGGIQTQEEFERYHDCAVRLYSALKNNMPDMLVKLEFFEKAFY